MKDPTGNCVALNSEFVTVVDVTGDRSTRRKVQEPKAKDGQRLMRNVTPNRVNFSYLSKDTRSEHG